MRAVVGCAIVSVLCLCAAPLARGNSPSLPKRDFSCEEECREERARSDAACEELVLDEGARGFCHQTVRARHDVCMRLCED
jgi:hypothetical protein